MERFYIITIGLSLLISCSKHEEKVLLEFKFNSNAVVVLHDSSNNNPSIYVQYTSLLPQIPMKIYSTSIDSNNNILLRMKINRPLPADLFINNLWLPIFVVPDDTLYIYFNSSDSKKTFESISFKGSLAPVNNYLKIKHEKYHYDFDKKRQELFTSGLPALTCRDSIDRLKEIEMQYLLDYDKVNGLPEWYLKYASSEIIYRNTQVKIGFIPTRESYFNIVEKVPSNYYDFVDSIEINNNDAIVTAQYYSCLDSYTYFKYVTEEIKQLDKYTRLEKSVQIQIAFADSLLTGEKKDIFKCYVISNNFRYQKNHVFAAKIIEEQRKSKMDAKYITFLENYYDSVFSLKEGDLAPEIYLPNEKNQFESLAKYKGKVILLNFWHPGCLPCRKEIPFEKDIVKKMEGKDFALLNICLFTSKPDWQKALKTLGLEGVNIFAEQNWAKVLRESYMLGPYPHYVLIDRDGAMIKNRARKPSEGLLEDILDAIEK